REEHPVGEPHRVGIVGLGVISRQYLKTLVGHPRIRVTAVADLDASRAAAVEAPGVAAVSVDRLLDDADVETVLNLTIPAAHADVALGALSGGKHVYT